MIDKMFLGTLRKYDNFRADELIYVKAVIKHIDESSTQEFLTPFAKKLGIDNIIPLFAFPVRWKKLVLDTSDYIQSKYRINFGDTEFQANLQNIGITRKLVDGSDIFEYSLEFVKQASDDLEDRVIVEAYLDYKEENAAGKMVYKEFEVKLELLEEKSTLQADSPDDLL